MATKCTKANGDPFILEDTLALLEKSSTNLAETALVVTQNKQEEGRFCIFSESSEPWVGIKLHVNEVQSEPLKDYLQITTVNIIPKSHIATILNHPFTQFQMGRDGKGLGIADIRDLRTGGKVTMKFDLYKTDLTLAIIRDDNRPTFVLGWDSDYSPIIF